MTTLKEDVCRAVVAQVKRYDDSIGKTDNSAYESYGRIKDVLECVDKTVKPLANSLKNYWGEVIRKEDDTQAAFLREMQTEAEAAICQLICLAAVVSRALWSVAPFAERKVGQMSIDDWEEEQAAEPEETPEVLPAVDEDTGEVVEEVW